MFGRRDPKDPLLRRRLADFETAAEATRERLARRRIGAAGWAPMASHVVTKEGEHLQATAPDGAWCVPGQWLWFLFIWDAAEATPGGIPLFVADAACFFLNIPREIEVTAADQPFRGKFPKDVGPYLEADGSYEDWQPAFGALDNCFSNDRGWRGQWSRRTPRVEELMTGQNTGWTTVRSSR